MARDGHVKAISKNLRCLSKLTSLDFQIYKLENISEIKIDHMISFYNVRGTFLAPLQQSLRLLPSLRHLKIMNELYRERNIIHANNLL